MENLIKDYHLICREIHISAKKQPTAVFAIRGDVIVIAYKSQEFQIMVQQYPRSFVGIYDEHATLKMIQDDIL